MYVNIIRYTMLGLFFGTFGTMIGGIIGILIKKISNKFLSFILALTSGLMLSIVAFELIPDAMEISGIFISTIGIIMGITTMIICDLCVKSNSNFSNKSSILQAGIIISIGLALHNIPEGLAIGTGFESSLKLGISLAITIAIHDVPEGISMAIPMKNGGMSSVKVLMFVLISGLATGAGAFIGAIIGSVSEEIIAICLSFAAGAMLYVVSGELIPEYSKLYIGKWSILGNIIGFILGFIASGI